MHKLQIQLQAIANGMNSTAKATKSWPVGLYSRPTNP